MNPVLPSPDVLAESVDHYIRHRKPGEDALEGACDLIWPSLESLMVEWLSEADITRLFRSETSQDGAVSFTMAGLWRIVRSQGRTRTYRRDLKRRQWKADKTLDHWPTLKLLPCGTDKQLPFAWENLLEHAFNEVFQQTVAALILPQPWRRDLQRELRIRWHRLNIAQVLMGLDRDVGHLVLHVHNRYPLEAENCESCIDDWGTIHGITVTDYAEYPGPDRGPEVCAQCAYNQRVLEEYERHTKNQLATYDRYLSHIRALDLGRGRPYYQQRHIATRNMKALGSALWRDVVDRASLSLTSRIVGPRARLLLTDLLRVQVQHAAVERIATERPQLLPMLSVIHPRHWHRDDLFSRRLWVRQRDEKTIVDRKTFCPSRRIGSLNEKRSFRFLSRSPASVVTMILNVWQDTFFGWHRNEADAVLQFIQAVTPTQDHRPYAKVLGATAGLKVVKEIKGNRFGRDRLTTALAIPVFGRLARAWVADRLETWRTRGYRELMRTHPQAEQALRNALDWSASTDHHLPDNNMDWKAIQRHSDAWHEALQQQHRDRAQYRGQALAWTSPLQEIRSDTYVAVALTYSQSLQQEAHEMGHCVDSYDIECYEGSYLVFSIKPLGPDADKNDRATLGVYYSRCGARFDQLEGPCHQSTPKPIQDFAQHVVQSLNDAILEEKAA
ncbi:hypothetical protein R5R73_01850 [Salinicola sp. LHM]|uniref:hypothetical protein n=1 Tax=Salinicola sp. LHM TaxID=3065298 RepID=UPI002ACE4942|nr:hypothetical protein [Salinicola sp. LHM]WQH33460.1 hypothetical protein R5R73_01850 [Salinicola sp. LHM]